MRITELMKGDWVQVPMGEYDRISAIYSNSIFCTEHHTCNSVEPIPLTKEILEKNGFPFNEEETEMSFYAELFDFPLGRGFYIEHDIIDDVFFITDHCLIRFKYVHEFQHILKLCGINKEIKLLLIWQERMTNG